MNKEIKVQSPLAPLDKGGILVLNFSPFTKGAVSEASRGFVANFNKTKTKAALSLIALLFAMLITSKAKY